MKITWIEKLINEGLVKSYEYHYSENGLLLLIDINTGKCVLFDDDLNKIKKIAKKNNAWLQYICAQYDGNIHVQKLCFVI